MLTIVSGKERARETGKSCGVAATVRRPRRREEKKDPSIGFREQIDLVL